MRLFIIFFLLFPFIIGAAQVQTQSATHVKNLSTRIMPGHYLNEQAPTFSLSDHQGVLRNLSDYRGKKIILYFLKTDSDDLEGYPFRISENITHALLLNFIVPWCVHNNIEIIGISNRTPEDLALLKKRHNINYVLLSDTTQFFAGLYGAVDEFYQAIRTSLLIDEAGIVRCTVQSYDASTNVVSILIHLLIAMLPK